MKKNHLLTRVLVDKTIGKVTHVRSKSSYIHYKFNYFYFDFFDNKLVNDLFVSNLSWTFQVRNVSRNKGIKSHKGYRQYNLKGCRIRN